VKTLVYGLALSLLLGTNVRIAEVGGRPIFFGTTDAILAALTAVGLAKWAIGRYSLEMPRGVILALGIFSFFVVSSLVWRGLRVSGALPVDGVIEGVRWFLYAAIVPFGMMALKNRRDAAVVMSMVVAAATVNALVALHQVATVNLSEARPFGLLIGAFDRQTGTGSNPNVLGTILMMASCLLVAALLSGRGVVRLALFAVLMTEVAGLTVSLSRSALLGFLFGLVVIVGGRSRQRLGKLVLALAILLCIGMVVDQIPVLENRLAASIGLPATGPGAEGALLSTSARIELWKAVIGKWEEFAVTGVGYGCFASTFLGRVADNLYLEIAATTGVLGLWAFCWLLWRLWVLSRGIFRMDWPDCGAWVVVGFRGALVGICVASLTGGVLLSPRVLGVWWLMVVAAARILRGERRQGVGSQCGAKGSCW
jgi:O-antigen ligase